MFDKSGVRFEANGTIVQKNKQQHLPVDHLAPGSEFYIPIVG